jgi:hypothetical protein
MSIIMKRASTVQVAQRSRDEEKKIHQVEVNIMQSCMYRTSWMYLIS